MSHGGADFSALQEFYNKLNANFNQAECQRFIEKCAAEIAQRFMRTVKQRTPVGHYNGSEYVCDAKASKLNPLRIHGGRKVKKIEGSGTKVGGRLRSSWTSTSPVYGNLTCTVTFSNNALTDDGKPYSLYVEYGHRVKTKNGYGWNKGHFMLTSTEQDFEKIIPKLLEKRLNEKLREVFR